MNNVNNTKELRNYEQRQYKPVWRVNTGNGVPSDFDGGSIVYMDGCLITSFGNSKDPEYFVLTGNDCNIAAYQTNRTKEAKYEKDACDECLGSGNEINWDDENCLPIDETTCQSCEGRATCYFNIERG